MKNGLRIVYLGSGEFGLPCLEAMRGSRHSVEFVVTQPPRAAGRGRQVRATAVAEWAQGAGVPCMEAEDVNAAECVEKIAGYRPDILLVIAFGQFVGERLINLAEHKAINVHASLLPKYRGAAPINWAIVNGEKETGVSIFRLVKKMDAGDVVAQARTEIREKEAADELHDRLAQLAAPLLVQTLDKIADGSAVYVPQDESKVSFAPKLKKEDGHLDFSESAEVIERKIRGFWPWPGASCEYVKKSSGKREKVTIAAAQVLEKDNMQGAAPGTVDDELDVICGKHTIRITKLKPAGKGVMEFRDFVNGRNTRAGERFEVQV